MGPLKVVSLPHRGRRYEPALAPRGTVKDGPPFRNHPKLPTRFSVELGGRNDLGQESVACWPVGRVTLRFVKGENRPIVLGGRADRPSTAAARLGGRWRLCDVAPSEGRGPLRREDGVRPGT